MPEGIAYQNKDIEFKLMSETYKEKSFEAYGLKLPKIKEVLPTNLPAVSANEMRIDNLFLLEDDTVAIVDYESEDKTSNRVKYINYIGRIMQRYDSQGIRIPELRMIVIYTGDVETAKDTWEIISGAEYLELWAPLGNSNYLMMRSPLDSIRSNVTISNQFIFYIGIVILGIGVILVWFFSRQISEPILELAELSKKMAKLDFDAKYTRGGVDEIGILGKSFNTMSDELKEKISELKTANYELQKDIKKKEQIETMRTEFIGNVSHELKTPIALIQGYAEGLKDGITDDPESMEFYCDVIIDEAGKMNRMVKNLLTLNQLELGRDDTQFERIDITSLIQGVVQSLDIVARQKEVDVRMNVSGPVYVWADEFKVEQVVRNYVNNALNHVDGQRIIDIRIEEREGKIRVNVFNTGKPIPEEDIAHIWEKFYKVDKARTREYGGNGIGLSIVKAIMESFHQNYGVRNYENGVQFWFELDKK